MDSDSYYYCSKYKSWIPAYVSYIHNEQCNYLTDCEMLHPIVKHGMLIARIAIIRKEVSSTDLKTPSKSSKNSISQGNWLFCEEPEIMQKVKCKFFEKMAFFSESDLYCCGIEGFSSVLIQANESRAVFTAVPCAAVQNGTLRLYEEGIINHLYMARDTTLVSVEKIDNLKIGREVRLKTNENGNNALIPRIFKQKFYYGYDYGIPCLLEKNDMVSVTFAGKCDVKMNISIEDTETSEDCSHLFSVEAKNVSQGSITKSLTLLSLKDSFLETSPSSEFSANRDLLKKSVFSEIEGTNVKDGDHSFKTSTPRKENKSSNCTPKGSRDKKKRKQKEGASASFIFLRRPWFSLSLYRLSRDFTIEMVTKMAEDKTLLTKRNAPFFKDKSFYCLKNVIQKKLLHFSQGPKLRCPWTGILLSGLPGTGKSLLMKEVSAELGLPLITISLLEWAASASSSYMEQRFHEAKQRAPSILLFEEIDSFCPSAREQNQQKFTSKILKIIAASKALTKPILIVGTSNRSEAIPDSLKRVERFDREVILGLPSPETRGAILWQLLDSLRHTLMQENVNHLGRRAFGLSNADLNSVVQIAWQKAISRWKGEKAGGEQSTELHLNLCDLEEAVSMVTPSFLRQSYSAVSVVWWSDIFGYNHIKEKLKKMVACMIAERCSKGILLYGPPGCSKTMLVRALVSETMFNFFPVKCSDLLSKFVGETEKSLCSVFNRAAMSAPSLIFIDEIDSLCGRRTGTANESGVVTELLSLLQKSRKEADIFVVGATNRPQAVDEALFAPGGLELLVHVDLPDCASRCSIWKGLLKIPPTDGEINIQLLCSKSEGFSCAEICIAYQNAAYFLLNTLHSGKIKWEELKLSEMMLLQAVDSVVPRTALSVLSAVESFKSTKKAGHE